VQKHLARLRYLPKKAVDGVAGYRTNQAVMAFQSWEGLQRDGVVGPQTVAALRKAKRPQPGSKGPARRIETYNAKGVTLLIEGGKVKRAIHSSSGKPGYATPTGTYTVFRKEKRSWSYPYSVWLPWASYFNNGIAFHEYPDVPPYPASHGCVRIPAPEAKVVYRFATIGTTVVVY
jgi:peptidoglycan hydrolase-like protein with peptidoglycan-binding domain